jgi:hypothetical protein
LDTPALKKIVHEKLVEIARIEILLE